MCIGTGMVMAMCIGSGRGSVIVIVMVNVVGLPVCQCYLQCFVHVYGC